jgi:competence protein ComEC
MKTISLTPVAFCAIGAALSFYVPAMLLAAGLSIGLVFVLFLPPFFVLIHFFVVNSAALGAFLQARHGGRWDTARRNAPCCRFSQGQKRQAQKLARRPIFEQKLGYPLQFGSKTGTAAGFRAKFRFYPLRGWLCKIKTAKEARSRFRTAAMPHTAPNSRRKAAALICLAFFTGGLVFGLAARREAFRQALIFPGQAPEKITALRGTLADDPRSTKTDRGMANLKLEYAYSKSGVRTSARGTALVFFPAGTLPRLKEFGRGSIVYIDGAFVPAEEAERQPAMFRAVSAHVVRAPSFLDRTRTGIRLALLDFFGEKWGGLSMALLLGIRDNLDGEIAKQYTNAGCSYILALSGMHLAIISSVIALLLKKPLGLKGAALAGSCFIVAYVFLVGAQASLVRAAIMYLVGAAAIIFALPADAFLLLCLSFLLQIGGNPASGDALSFILSYLALAGILIFTETIQAAARGLLPDVILSPLSASLSAFLATMGVSALFFGELRLAGILAGLIMVPLTTFFMLGSMAYLLLGLVPYVKIAAGFLLNLLYLILEKVSYVASRAPPLTFRFLMSNLKTYSVLNMKGLSPTIMSSVLKRVYFKS